MKNFQQNLLILLALGLCGLCVYQWYGQTVQRNQIGQLNQTVYEKSAAIQGYTNSIASMDHQIAQMGSELSQLRSAARTNEQLIVFQKGEINKLQLTAEGLTNQISEYKQAVNGLETKLKEAYAGIQKQNDALKELATQRDEFVKKFNESVKDRNDIVNKYNDLAAQVEKLQKGNKQ
jgi:chromosome segregation ATPase